MLFMEINSIKTSDMVVPTYNSQAAQNEKTDEAGTASQEIGAVKTIAEDGTQTDKTGKKAKEPKADEVKEMTDAMNKFMQSLNADLQFAMHQRTQRLMVQLVNSKDNKVLKEFPPKEFLDMIAKIRDYVGAILDKKA